MFSLRLSSLCLPRACQGFVGLSRSRLYSTTRQENLDVSHADFLANASPKKKWKPSATSEDDDLDGVTGGRGKLLPTSSHLFKLVLPLDSIEKSLKEGTKPSERHKTVPTVFLLHPSQPLSHVSRLITSSLALPTPTVSFRSVSYAGKAFQWSDSTDLSDFIKDAARAAEFTICISNTSSPGSTNGHTPVEAEASDLDTPAADQEHDRVVSSKPVKEKDVQETLLTVAVPTFADRTRFMRRRLDAIDDKLKEMEGLKAACDREAHLDARRMARAGLGMLVVYWGAVARLTFWDFGWDVMEPVTYLSGLSMVILGYLWFLYQGREVSYTSVLARSVSSRREALYKARGLDIEHWMEMVSERKALRAEIGKIAMDYEGDKDDGAASKNEEFYNERREAMKDGEEKLKEGTGEEEVSPAEVDKDSKAAR